MVVYSALLAANQLILKAGMNQVGKITPERYKSFFGLALSNYYVLLGLATGFVVVVFWLIILSWFDLNLVYPLATLSLVMVWLFSLFFLKEKITVTSTIGTFIIILGVYILLRPK